MAGAADNSNERGKRADKVAQWYFRLNGCLQTGFVLHSDEVQRQVTDADILAVRFPHSEESLRGIRMIDDRWLFDVAPNRQTLFVIVEVTQGRSCKVNGPWVSRESGGMEIVIRRLGFAPPEMTDEIANEMYNRLRWESNAFVLQYVAIGDSSNRDLRRYPDLIQLTWSDIATFFWERFHGFGPIKGWPPQWPDFARRFAQRVNRGEITSAENAARYTISYIMDGPQRKGP